MQGHVELWRGDEGADGSMPSRNTDADYMRAAELEGAFAEHGGYDAEARAPPF